MVARALPGEPVGAPARRVAFDVLVALGVAVLTLPAIGRGGYGLLPALGFGMAAALLMRRGRPVVVMLITGVLALIELIVFPPDVEPQAFNLAVVVAMYTVVKYCPTLRPGVISAAFVGAAVAVETIRHADLPQGWQNGILYVAVCGGGWLAGYVVRTRHAYITGLEERAATAERERDHLTRIAVAEERATIARELHDVVAHSLAVMIVQADGADYALRGDPESARAAIRQVAVTGREALDDMRRLVGVLRGGPDDVETGSLAEVPAPRRPAGLGDLESLVERAESARIDVEFRTIGIRRPLPSAVELTLYRIVQEALTNVLRHAGPGTSVRLVLQYGIESVAVTVTDNGHGAVTPPSSGGHGLIGMRERVAVLGGWFTAGPATGGGWRVDARVPVTRAAREEIVEAA